MSENTEAVPKSSGIISPRIIWAVTSGGPGMKSQVMGLASALVTHQDDQIIEKTIALKAWAAPFPGHLNPIGLKSLSDASDNMQPPWPDILITSGRRCSAASIAIGRASGGRCFRIHLQNPQTPPHYFDVIVSMVHDQLSGPNVLQTRTALHKLQRQDLDQPREFWQAKFPTAFTSPAKEGPLIGLALGGKNKKFGFDDARTEALINLIKTTISRDKARFLITPSSRTESFVKTRLQAAFADDENVWLWHEQGENPYFAILAHADHLLITADSVSMISEALYTGKPTHIFELNGTSRRHRIFLDTLLNDQLIHKAETAIDFSVHAPPSPVDETARIAQIIKEIYAKHPKGPAS